MGFFKTVASAALGYVASATVPTSKWSKMLLADELRTHGVAMSLIPDDCLQQLADDVVHGSQAIARLTGEKVSTSDLVGAVEAHAALIADYILGDGLPAVLSDDPAEVMPTSTLDILRRFGVKPHRAPKAR
jgi:hypothetical protein